VIFVFLSLDYFAYYEDLQFQQVFLQRRLLNAQEKEAGEGNTLSMHRSSGLSFQKVRGSKGRGKAGR
jgi:hypothetical protein